MTSKPTRPRYKEIADDLRAKIHSGELAPGETLPREKALMEELGVAQSTVRQAYSVLRAEGLIESRQGSSVKVRAYKPIIRNAAKRLSADVWMSGRSIWDIDLDERRPEVQTEVDKIDAPERIAAILGQAGRVCRRQRRFSLDGQQLQLSTSYFAADLAELAGLDRVDTGPGGMYARLAEVGRKPVEAREQTRARMPSPDEAEALGLGDGTPVIIIVRTVADEAGRILEVNEMTLDASKYILENDFPL